MMKCKNCGTMCGAVAGFDRPFCCIACDFEYEESHKN